MVLGSLLTLPLALSVGGCGGGSSAFSSTVQISGANVTPEGYLDRCPLSVWGDSPTSVYFVGGGLGVVTNGQPVPGLFMHWDGKDFTELGSVAPTLWWVTGFNANDVWAAGEKGTIVHWNGSTLNVIDTGVNATLPGIWGSSSSDLWAVGGTLGGAVGENDVILHCTGSCDDKGNWKKVDPKTKTGGAYFKIWGAGPNDIFLVGLLGVIAHYDGNEWTNQTVPSLGTTTVPLLTVNGLSGSDVWVVGGPPGTLLHSTDDGKTWTVDTTQAFSTGLAGVFEHPDGDLFVVGLNGQKYVRSKGAWKDYTTSDPPQSDIHAVWIDSTGKNGFAVGGNYTSPPTAVPRRIGVVTRIGASVPPATLK